MSFLFAFILWMSSLTQPLPQSTISGNVKISGNVTRVAPAGGGAVYAYIGTNKNLGTLYPGGPVSVSCSGGTLACTSGDAADVFFFSSAGGTPLSAGAYSVTDNSGDTATLVKMDTTSLTNLPFAHYVFPTLSAGVTSFSLAYTGGTGSKVFNIIVGEFSRSGGTGLVDQLSSVATGTATTFTAGPITPTVTHSVSFGWWYQTASQVCSGSSGYTHLSDIGDGTDGLCVVYAILSSAASTTPTATAGSATYYGYGDNIQ